MFGSQTGKTAAETVQRFFAVCADTRPEKIAVLFQEKEHRPETPPGIQHSPEQVIEHDRLPGRKMPAQL